MTELIPEDPPGYTDKRGARRNRAPFAGWLHSLRDHPNVWHRYPEPRATGDVGKIHTGKVGGVKAGEYEATSAVVPGTNRYTVWARYIGDA